MNIYEDLDAIQDFIFSTDIKIENTNQQNDANKLIQMARIRIDEMPFVRNFLFKIICSSFRLFSNPQQAHEIQQTLSPKLEFIWDLLELIFCDFSFFSSSSSFSMADSVISCLFETLKLESKMNSILKSFFGKNVGVCISTKLTILYSFLFGHHSCSIDLRFSILKSMISEIEQSITHSFVLLQKSSFSSLPQSSLHSSLSRQTLFISNILDHFEKRNEFGLISYSRIQTELKPFLGKLRTLFPNLAKIDSNVSNLMVVDSREVCLSMGIRFSKKEMNFIIQYLESLILKSNSNESLSWLLNGFTKTNHSNFEIFQSNKEDETNNSETLVENMIDLICESIGNASNSIESFELTNKQWFQIVSELISKVDEKNSKEGNSNQQIDIFGISIGLILERIPLFPLETIYGRVCMRLVIFLINDFSKKQINNNDNNNKNTDNDSRTISLFLRIISTWNDRTNLISQSTLLNSNFLNNTTQCLQFIEKIDAFNTIISSDFKASTSTNKVTSVDIVCFLFIDFCERTRPIDWLSINNSQMINFEGKLGLVVCKRSLCKIILDSSISFNLNEDQKWIDLICSKIELMEIKKILSELLALFFFRNRVSHSFLYPPNQFLNYKFLLILSSIQQKSKTNISEEIISQWIQQSIQSKDLNQQLYFGMACFDLARISHLSVENQSKSTILNNTFSYEKWLLGLLSENKTKALSLKLIDNMISEEIQPIRTIILNCLKKLNLELISIPNTQQQQQQQQQQISQQHQQHQSVRSVQLKFEQLWKPTTNLNNQNSSNELTDILDRFLANPLSLKMALDQFLSISSPNSLGNEITWTAFLKRNVIEQFSNYDKMVSSTKQSFAHFLCFLLRNNFDRNSLISSNVSRFSSSAFSGGGELVDSQIRTIEFEILKFFSIPVPDVESVSKFTCDLLFGWLKDSLEMIDDQADAALLNLLKSINSWIVPSVFAQNLRNWILGSKVNVTQTKRFIDLISNCNLEVVDWDSFFNFDLISSIQIQTTKDENQIWNNIFSILEWLFARTQLILPLQLIQRLFWLLSFNPINQFSRDQQDHVRPLLQKYLSRNHIGEKEKISETITLIRISNQVNGCQNYIEMKNVVIYPSQQHQQNGNQTTTTTITKQNQIWKEKYLEIEFEIVSIVPPFELILSWEIEHQNISKTNDINERLVYLINLSKQFYFPFEFNQSSEQLLRKLWKTMLQFPNENNSSGVILLNLFRKLFEIFSTHVKSAPSEENSFWLFSELAEKRNSMDSRERDLICHILSVELSIELCLRSISMIIFNQKNQQNQQQMLKTMSELISQCLINESGDGDDNYLQKSTLGFIINSNILSFWITFIFFLVECFEFLNVSMLFKTISFFFESKYWKDPVQFGILVAVLDDSLFIDQLTMMMEEILKRKPSGKALDLLRKVCKLQNRWNLN